MPIKNKNIILKYLAILAALAVIFLSWPQIEILASNNNNTNQPGVGEEEEISEEEAEEVEELNLQIEQKKQEVEELEGKIEHYKDNIETKQKEALTLSNQVSVLDDQIGATTLDIQATEKEIETTGLEIESKKREIEAKNQEIDEQKDSLAELMRNINRYDQKTYLEITLAHSTFSEFFIQMKQLEELQTGVQDALEEVKILKADLESKKQALENKKVELDTSKDKLEVERGRLEGEQGYKNELLAETKSSEYKFQGLLEEIKKEYNQINAEISSLETQVRNKFSDDDKWKLLGEADLAWPVNPLKGITAYFHDPTYIFRRYFEHPGVDVALAQGSPVGAAASGYVAIAKDAGMGYSYVLIVHNDELSTVYGHLSQINVQAESFVTRGQTIGLSGGMPGTPGAGRLTTGPHLHFEVRLNGIPVNPLEYLPAF